MVIIIEFLTGLDSLGAPIIVFMGRQCPYGFYNTYAYLLHMWFKIYFSAITS